MNLNPSSIRSRSLALLVAAVVVFGVAGCGSSDSTGSASDTTAPAGSTDDTGAGSTDETPADVDPCQWYTAEEMSELVGFTVTMEEKETPQALGAECLYENAEEFTGITVRPTTAADYDQLKAGAAATGIGGEQIDYPGVGDEAYHNGEPGRPNPSVSFSAKKGDDAIQVELAAASGGPVESVDASIEITSTIATKALG